MKLSENLKYWRAERPSEWIMDEFIKQAEKIESLCKKWFLNPVEYGECIFCGTDESDDGITHHSADCPYIKYLDIIV